MEVYTTENEQVDALRRFLIENGKALVVGIVLGIGALVGWRYWQNHQSEGAMSSSLAYQQASEALAKGDAPGVSAAEKFAVENKNSYGVLSSLQLARYHADKGEFAQAETQLRTALTQTKDVDLQALTALRLARVQVQQGKADDALKTLDTIKQAGWAAMVADVRGDALVSKGDNAAARAAYDKGVAANPPQALQALLRMKLNNLPG
ncbi:YfgM family protein [Candidatus Symbiopectobacterium sp. NZEC127]|uniref:YfgM family protein n=1 Tax=Candidatus Symbiopectobacterium sp. NZEC127 TaxID=2820472 RepID=UPI002225DC95|nr:YfgM family protein [Candidatus Symbiopectobacterium sp. NZEC127]MCW2486171.1 YfgM family protein [Candidatus Symbiopectobacterium sp. NZEC127]